MAGCRCTPSRNTLELGFEHHYLEVLLAPVLGRCVDLSADWFGADEVEDGGEGCHQTDVKGIIHQQLYHCTG